MSTMYALKESAPDNLLDDFIDSVSDSVQSALKSVHNSLTSSSPTNNSVFSEDGKAHLIELEQRDVHSKLDLNSAATPSRC
jgi:hypothetical protein